MNIATRSINTQSGTYQVEAARAIIEAYAVALRSIPLAYLVNIEKRVERFDVSFVLTFESMHIQHRSTDDAVIYEVVRPV